MNVYITGIKQVCFTHRAHRTFHIMLCCIYYISLELTLFNNLQKTNFRIEFKFLDLIIPEQRKLFSQILTHRANEIFECDIYLGIHISSGKVTTRVDNYRVYTITFPFKL